jgi:hypothetical protein
LPAAEHGQPESGFLEQAGLSTLFFEIEGPHILFIDLQEALEKIEGPSGDDATLGEVRSRKPVT